MKWIKCSDQPPLKGAVVRHVSHKQVLKEWALEGLGIAEYDECSEVIAEYALFNLEWLDETPELDSVIKSGVFLKCECGLVTEIDDNRIDYDVDYNSVGDFDGVSNMTVSCKCGKEVLL